MKNLLKIAKGFTLLELLVVVLIIGILAAIALPQYKQVVLRSKFAKVKSNVQALVGAMQRYYLTNNKYPNSLSKLDIEVEDKEHEFYYTSSDSRGTVSGKITSSTDKPILVYTITLGTPYEWQTINTNVYYCVAYATHHSGYDTNFVNKICQTDTGKTEYSYKTGDYTWYAY